MHDPKQALTLQLLRDHPGWSDQRVASELDLSASTVRAWRRSARLAPATDRVERWPPPRRQGVPLACGHLVHPEKITADRGRCDYCAGHYPVLT